MRFVTVSVLSASFAFVAIAVALIVGRSWIVGQRMKTMWSMIALAVFGVTTSVVIAGAATLQHKPLDGLPSIAGGQVFDDDWNPDHRNAASERFSAVLQR